MEEIDLKQLVKLFWNKRLHITIITTIFIVIGIIYSFAFVTPKYQSYTTLVLAQKELSEDTSAEITQSDITLNQKLIATYSELIKTKNILRSVINNLGLKINEDTLRNNVKVTSVEDTELIKISVTNENPTDAKNIANEIAKIFSQKVSEIYNIKNVYIVDNAEEATKPCNISHIRDIAIFAVIGIVVSIVYVLIANLFDTTVKDEEEIEKALGVSVLVSIPELRDENKLGKGGLY